MTRDSQPASLPALRLRQERKEGKRKRDIFKKANVFVSYDILLVNVDNSLWGVGCRCCCCCCCRCCCCCCCCCSGECCGWFWTGALKIPAPPGEDMSCWARNLCCLFAYRLKQQHIVVVAASLRLSADCSVQLFLFSCILGSYSELSLEPVFRQTFKKNTPVFFSLSLFSEKLRSFVKIFWSKTVLQKKREKPNFLLSFRGALTLQTRHFCCGAKKNSRKKNFLK